MNTPLLTLVAMVIGTLTTNSGDDARVTYVEHQKVAAALKQGGTLVKASDLVVEGAHRVENGKPEWHEKQTDVFYIVDGEATFVTGGELVDSHTLAPGQRTGTDIRGGEVRHLSAGDVIVIPAGIPHWFKEVPHSVSYYVVKVLKP